MMESKGARAFTTFVQLTPGADPAVVAARIPGIVETITGRSDAARAEAITGSSEAVGSYALQPLQSIYFDTEVSSNIGPSGNPLYLTLCAILAAVILTIAGVNYVNLATARAGRRTHEIGVRKTLGAHRSQLIGQLLSESVLLSTAATVLGVAVAEVVILLIPAITGIRFRIVLPALDPPGLRRGCGTGGGGRIGRGCVPGMGGGALSAGDRSAWGPRGRCASAPGLSSGAVHGHGGVDDHDAADMAPTRLRPKPPPRGLGLGVRAGTGSGRSRNSALTMDRARTFKTELLQDSRIAAVSLSLRQYLVKVRRRCTVPSRREWKIK